MFHLTIYFLFLCYCLLKRFVNLDWIEMSIFLFKPYVRICSMDTFRREKFKFLVVRILLPYFSQFVKNQNEENMIFKCWNFCNSVPCLHNMLSQRTTASNTECKISNKKAEDLNKCVIFIWIFKKKWIKNWIKIGSQPFFPPPTQNVN